MINKGKFEGTVYKKFVSFSKAVLWKDRQLSLSLPIMAVIKKNKIATAEFIDHIKAEKWIFNTDEIIKYGKTKTVGQEPQWYFPIDIAKKEVYV